MDYKDFFLTDNKSGWKTREDRLKKNFPDIHEKVIKYSNSNGELNNISFKEKIWHFINNSIMVPNCHCGNKVKFKGNLIYGYNLNCSLKCSANNELTKQKNEKTSLEKYGVKHPSKSDVVRDKYKKTCVDKYGVDNVSKVNEVRDKANKTTLEKFGVKSVLSLPENRDKLKEFSLLNYGVSHPSKSDEIKLKVKNTLIKNYSVDNPMKSVDIKEKYRASFIDNYGVDNPMRHSIMKNKCIDNMVNTKYDKFISYFDKLKIDNIIEWDGDMLTLNCNKCDNDYSLSRELFKLRYNKDRETCLHCNPLYKKDSYGENELEGFIKSLINYKVEINNREILNGKELDVYIPDKNLAFEYNGIYWHNELNVDKGYHLNKTELCEAKGIRLIHIFEDEWLFKRDIVESRIKNILGLTTNKIYGRKCVIKEILPTESKDFLNNNHIQGNVNSSIKLGLYYNDELVSLMTFGKGRIIMGGKLDEYELLRFCNKLDTTVIGGADKLLKYFIKKYNPVKIISYADIRWSQGELYDKLGFEFIHNSKPNYFYVINTKREYRFGYRKDLLVKQGYDKNKSEHQIMLDRGIYRIYDCGTKRYELNF